MDLDRSILVVDIDDSLCLHVEHELLSSSIDISESGSLGLDSKIGSVRGAEISTHVHSRLEVEWSVNVETVWLVHTLDWLLVHIIDVNDSPFLVQTVMLSVMCDNILSFLVGASVDIEDLGLIRRLDMLSNILESIPPLVGEVSALKVSGRSVVLDVHGVVVVSS